MKEVSGSVLIVDDMKSACAALGALLRECGIDNIDLCFDGESALKRVINDRSEYDAVFIDLHMKGMDGLELIHQLHEEHFRGAVVVMTAMESKIMEMTLEILSNYCVHVLGSLEKPFDTASVAFLARRIQTMRSIAAPEVLPLSRRELFNALKSDAFQVYFQPKIDGRTKAIIGLEALLRLNEPALGPVSPLSVVASCEKYDLLENLTDAVLNDALPKFLSFRNSYDEPCHLAINLSPLQLRNQLLPESLSEYIGHYCLAREDIVLEITEHHQLNETVQMKNVNRLKIAGFSISLDDYGHGYTNLRQLRKLPLDEIKLDAAFVKGVYRDKSLQLIVTSVKYMADKHGLALVVEGVEDARDYEYLTSIGIQIFQGFLFCRPKPISEIGRWYKAWKKSVVELNDAVQERYIPKEIKR